VTHRPGATVPRFGFIVSKAVGNAVVRNTIRRRLKSICLSLLNQVSADTDLVIRALPGARDASWTQLRDEVASVATRGSVVAKDGVVVKGAQA